MVLELAVCCTCLIIALFLARRLPYLAVDVAVLVAGRPLLGISTTARSLQVVLEEAAVVAHNL